MKLRLAENRSDFERVSDFRKTFLRGAPNAGGRSVEPEYYEWKYRGLPGAHKGLMYYVERDGELIAMVGICPKPLLLDGRELQGGEYADAFTSPARQREGLFTKLLNEASIEAERSGIDLIYGTPNPRTSLEPVLRDCDCVLARGSRLRYMVAPLNPRVLIGNRPLPVRVAGGVLLAGHRAISRMLRGSSRDSGTRWTDTLSDDVMRFAETLAPVGRIAVRKDRSYLSWRYEENPDRYRYLVLRSGRGGPLGLAVCTLGQKGSASMLYVTDMLTAPDDHASRTELGRGILQRASEERLDLVGCWQDAGLRRRYASLWRLGFLAFKNVPLIVRRTEVGREIDWSNARWDLSMGDTDNV